MLHNTPPPLGFITLMPLLFNFQVVLEQKGGKKSCHHGANDTAIHWISVGY